MCPRDKNYLTRAHIRFLIHHLLVILITSHTRNASIIVFPLTWVARSERQTGAGRADLWFTSRHVKKRILQVRRAERTALRPPCSARLGSARLGEGRHQRRMAPEHKSYGCCTRFHPHRIGAPYRVAMVYIHVTRSHVWHCLADEEGPIVPGANHANRLARRTATHK